MIFCSQAVKNQNIRLSLAFIRQKITEKYFRNSFYDHTTKKPFKLFKKQKEYCMYLAIWSAQMSM